eukprot:UN01497
MLLMFSSALHYFVLSVFSCEILSVLPKLYTGRGKEINSERRKEFAWREEGNHY